MVNLRFTASKLAKIFFTRFKFNMINMTSQINFQSKYKFVPKRALRDFVETSDKPIKQVSNLGSSYAFIGGDRLAYTDSAASCVIYGLNDAQSESGILGHYNQYPTIIFDVLRNVNDIKGRGFMVGGNRDCEEVFYKKALEEYNKKDIKTTIFYGQNRALDTSDVLFDRPNDTVYIGTSEKLENLEDIKRYYNVVKVADGDEIYIKDKKIEL